MNSVAWARSAARSTSASLASGRPKRMFSRARGREHHRVLRHQRDARAHVDRIGRLDRHAVERDRAACRIVEAQQQMKQRALAGARRADDRDLFAGLDRQRNVVDRHHIRPRRIGEADIVEADIAARRHRQRHRLWRRRDLRFHAQDLEQPFGGAGRGRDFAPDLAELAEAGRGERRIQHELAEPARADRAGQHVVRADPQDRHDAGEHDEDDDQREHRARPRRAARRLIGLLDLAAEARWSPAARWYRPARS